MSCRLIPRGCSCPPNLRPKEWDETHLRECGHTTGRSRRGVKCNAHSVRRSSEKAELERGKCSPLMHANRQTKGLLVVNCEEAGEVYRGLAEVMKEERTSRGTPRVGKGELGVCSRCALQWTDNGVSDANEKCGTD